MQLSKRLKTHLREQELNLGIAVAVYAILWGTGQRTDIAPILVYCFVLGNFVISFQKLVAPLVNRASFPLSLLVCLLLIYAATPIIKLSDSKLGVCIADVAGKSISAALLMANVQATVRAFASDVASPAWVCSHVNSVLCNNIARGKFVTFFYGVLDSALRRFEYCSAGHVPPILVRADGRSEALECQGAVLGVFPDWEYSDSTVQLTPGDRLVLFTDGASEACTPEGDEYGEERIAAAAARAVRMSGERILQSLITEVKAFCRFQLNDDLTLIVIAAE